MSVINVTTEYEMPREPKFYPNHLPITTSRPPMPQVKPPKSNDCISNYMSKDIIALKGQKEIARIKICGGGLTFTITDNMQFEMPTKEQCENLKKTFGIEVELIEKE